MTYPFHRKKQRTKEKRDYHIQQKKQSLFKVYDSIGNLEHYEFYNNNQLIYKGMYDSLNLKSGRTYFDEKNNMINTGYYTSNKKDKTWVYYYPNG